jgi:hypothetical protein
MIDKSITVVHHKSVLDKVRFLDSSHLRDDLKHVVEPFEKLAAEIMRKTPSSPELTIAMQKIVEAKDQTVRAVLHAQENNLPAPGVTSGSSSPADNTVNTGSVPDASAVFPDAEVVAPSTPGDGKS